METSTCSHVFALDCAAERSIRVRAYRLFLLRGCAGYGAFWGGRPGGNFRGRGYLLRLFWFFGLSITTCLTLCHHPAPASTAAKATATLHSVGAFRRTVAIYFSTPQHVVRMRPAPRQVAVESGIPVRRAQHTKRIGAATAHTYVPGMRAYLFSRDDQTPPRDNQVLPHPLTPLHRTPTLLNRDLEVLS
jgi:hypothetical protein